MPFGKFHIVAVFCPVVLSCLASVLFDSSVRSVVAGLSVVLSVASIVFIGVFL